MKILAITFVYNEMHYLPLMYEWLKKNNLDMYFIDNMSDDGTWQWLQRNNIPSHRVDTKGSFDLRILDHEFNKTIHKIKPDWVVFIGGDLFYCTQFDLKSQIVKADIHDFNVCKFQFLPFFNTGENPRYFDPLSTYKYYKEMQVLSMIAKYHTGLRKEADRLKRPGEKATQLPGFVANYGQTKTKEEREETRLRREKAWKAGLKKNYGNHYRKGHNRGWIWDKKDLHDITKSKYVDYWLPLLKVGNKNPLINILIRTSDRPKYFARLIKSINEQTYQNINLIISADNERTANYVEKSGYNPVMVEPVQRDKNKTFPYNLYLNKLLDQVRSGWVIIIDDDDLFQGKHVLKKISKKFAEGKISDLHVWQMLWPNGRLIPENEYMNKLPFKRKHISMQCFGFHHKYRSLQFDGNRAGDHRFINKLVDQVDNVKFHNEILIKLTNKGLNGRKIDLS